MNPFEVLIPLGAFAMFAWMVYVIVDGFRRRQQLRMMADFHAKLLDRVGSASELTEFLSTPGGTRFLESLTADRVGVDTQTKILRAVRAGIVQLVLGIGISWYASIHARGLGGDFVNALMLFAAIVLSVGVGLLISAFVSYRLSKRMGLLDGADQSGPAAQ